MNKQFAVIGENIVVIDGRLSIREDEPVKIVANNITEFNENLPQNIVGAGPVSAQPNQQTIQKPKTSTLNITNADETQKDKLRGAIRFFSGDKNNIKVQVNIGGELKPSGAIFLNERILEQFKEILGEENVELI